MISEKDLDRLKEINPFVDWEVIGLPLQTRTNKELQIFKGVTIPANMQYGDSIFVDKPYWFFQCLRNPYFRKRLKGIKIVFRWMDPDPVYNKPGVRIWSVMRYHKIQKPKHFKHNLTHEEFIYLINKRKNSKPFPGL